MTETPSTVAVPDVGSSSVASTRMVVDLPAPFGPMNPKIWPDPNENEMPFTARVRPYSLRRSRTSTFIAALPEDAEHGRLRLPLRRAGEGVVHERGGVHHGEV